MKRSLITALIAVPLVMMAQGYKLVINYNNGTKTEITTQEVSSIEFVNEDPGTPVDPDKPDPDNPDGKPRLSKPYYMILPQGDDGCLLSWSVVKNAVSYSWQLNDGEVHTVTGTQVTIGNFIYGKNTVYLWANPAENSQYAPSEKVVETMDGKLAVNVNVLSVDRTMVRGTVSLNANGEAMAGIVPATITDNAERVEYVKNNAAAQKVTFTSVPGTTHSLDFSGLTANTQYYIVVFLTAEPDNVKITKVVTSTDLAPGTKASIYPPGVTATSGWVDVDKVGQLSKYGWEGQDNLMCWACTISGIIQWWINDYKAKTGRDFQTVYPIPTESKCYSTPIMDLYNNYYAHAAGQMFNPLKWFFRKQALNNFDEDGKPMINESLPNWQGGFGGMNEDEVQAMMIVNKNSSQGHDVPEYDFNMSYDAKGKSAAEVTAVFSEKIVNDLREGPIAMCIGGSAGGSSVHGITCWGADYEVLSDGTYKVNRLYIGENDPLPGNVRNGLNPATISYADGAVSLNMSTSGTKQIKTFFGVRGYQGK